VSEAYESPIHQALIELAPSALYLEDGSLDYDAIDEKLHGILGVVIQEGQSIIGDSPLDTITSAVSIGMEINYGGPAKEPFFPSKEDDPIKYAFMMYLVKLLAENLEIDLPIGKVSPALEEDPYFIARLETELSRYFTDLEGSQKIRHGNLLDRHEALTPTLNNISDLRCIVAIPAAGHQEYGNIFKTLEQFSKQDLDKGTFEIFLYLNLPRDYDEHDGDLAKDTQKTLDEVVRFRELYPDVTVRLVTSTYAGDRPNIGAIRSDLWDLVGFNMKQRGREEDILVVSSDADIIHLNRQYLSGMVKTWEETGADVVTAHLLWQSVPNLPYDSTVNRLLRYQSFIDNLRDNYSKTLHTADANTGVSLAMYFAIGGYDRHRKLGEMNNLVDGIRQYRRADKNAEEYTPVKQVEAKSKTSYLKTHSRRLVKAMSLGRAPYEAWDQGIIKFGSDDELRTADMESQLAEQHAVENWKKWLKRDTPYYVYGVPLAKKRRILKAARQVLGFSDLYT